MFYVELAQSKTNWYLWHCINSAQQI